MDSEERHLLVNKLQKQIRKNNWNYLCHHPEVRAFVRVILNEVVREKPNEIYNFTANLFSCDNMDKLSKKVNEQIKRLNSMKDSEWTQYDGNMFFHEHSDSENSSINGNRQDTINTLLKFSGAFQEDDFRQNSEEQAMFLSIPSIRLSFFKN